MSIRCLLTMNKHLPRQQAAVRTALGHVSIATVSLMPNHRTRPMRMSLTTVVDPCVYEYAHREQRREYGGHCHAAAHCRHRAGRVVARVTYDGASEQHLVTG